MKAVLQRVDRASVAVDGKIIGECGKGLMILLGVADGDTEKDAEKLAAKILKLRIFSDENDKMNLSVKDIDGELLVISQFTLLANYAHGNRPDYMNAASPSVAEPLYQYFIEQLRAKLRKVESGVFGSDMTTEMITDGPVTIVMHSELIGGKK